MFKPESSLKYSLKFLECLDGSVECMKRFDVVLPFRAL